MSLPILKVRTNHSEYLIDQNAGKFARRTVHEHANPIPGFSQEEWHEYHEVYSGVEIGQPLIITMPDGGWIRSTLVQSVEEVETA